MKEGKESLLSVRWPVAKAMAGFVLFLLLAAFTLFVSNARAQSCQALFAQDPLSLLETARAALEKEQQDVRTRTWTPAQIQEISLMGRIAVATETLTVKYYRGLLAWKLGLLKDEIREIKERRFLDKVKTQWSGVAVIDGSTVQLFQGEAKLMRVLRFIRDELHVLEPSEAQAIEVYRAAKQLRKSELAGEEAARLELEKQVREILTTAFPGSPLPSLAKFREALEIKFPAVCCGRGDCPTCVHPNVVFRDQAQVVPGPSHRNAPPTATLPLYTVMQGLRSSFPQMSLGSNFWDYQIDPTLPRF